LTLKTLATGKIRVNLPLGPNGQVFGTLYTVPTGKTAYVKELLTMLFSAGQTTPYEIYILPSGITDLTTVASNVEAYSRAQTENKGITVFSGRGIAADAVNVFARNTILSAGDAIKCWVHYGAITPGNVDLFSQLSGDES